MRPSLALLAVSFWILALIAIAWGANIAISEALQQDGAKQSLHTGSVNR